MKETISSLRDRGVRFVRVLWCDNANVIRTKAAHIDTLEQSGGTVCISAAQQALPVMYDAVVPDSGLGPVGEIMLVPDWSTLRPLPYLPGFAEVAGDMMREGRAWEHCPRDFLRTQVSRLQGHGLELRAAFENEFFLLRKGDGQAVPSDNTVFAAAHAMNVSGQVILEAAEALTEQGVEVETYYPESGPGQHELSVRYRDALGAADQQLSYRETIRGVAARHGLIATFLPKIVQDKAGSGCHINMSLWKDGRNVTAGEGRNGLGEETQRFIAGVLAHLPSLCAITLPTPASYRRIRPHFWAGAFSAWGYDNREAAVRVFARPAKRFELKSADATANPYLALGAVIAAGLDGLERKLELPVEVAGDPGLLSDLEREKLGVSRLPGDLSQSLEALERDETLLEALGEARSRAFIAVRRAEWEALRETPFEDEVAMLLERY